MLSQGSGRDWGVFALREILKSVGFVLIQMKVRFKKRNKHPKMSYLLETLVILFIFTKSQNREIVVVVISFMFKRLRGISDPCAIIYGPDPAIYNAQADCCAHMEHH